MNNHLLQPAAPSKGSADDTTLIAAYSRAQALEDGVLVDVSAMAREAGFKVPVALTAALSARLSPSLDDTAHGQSSEGRLWDVLMLLRARVTDSDTVLFGVLLAEGDGRDTLRLRAVIGPGDDAEPVITIMFEEED